MEETLLAPSWGNLTLEQARLFISGVSDYAIYMLSPEGIVRSWNLGAQRFKGYSSDEIIGQHFSRFYTDEDRANGKPARALRIALEQGKYEEEGWRVRKDGALFWASVVIDPIRDANGELVGFAKITRDLSERRQAQEALLASEHRFRLLVKGVTDYAIYMLSPTGEVTNWNAGAERIKGYAEDEIVGSHFSRFYTDEDRAQNVPANALKKAAQEGRVEMEGWRVRKDGTRFWANVVIDAIYNERGELIGYAKVTRDITERKQAEEALEQAKEALFQSQKLEAIGKLTGGIAHDFNNLLAVIVSGLERLMSQPDSPPNPKILESMDRAASRAANLTQQLLAFARQQPLKQEKHNLNRVIESFEAVLRRVGGRNIVFDFKLASRLSMVMVDSTQFEAALLNLMTNAQQAMPDGGTLTVKTEDVEIGERQVGHLPAGRFVKVSVCDTGTGMSSEVAAKALEPFFTTKPLGEGTGMGLSQVYGFVQQSNGEMTIDTELGKGTSISLYLPALEPADGDVSTAARPRTEIALVVDDEPDVLNAAIALFEDMGYEVLSANSAAEALEIVRRHPDIDVLFTDVILPGMDGVELAQAVRQQLPGVRVLLTSGYPGTPSAESGNVPGNGFPLIAKPFRIADVARQLRMPG